MMADELVFDPRDRRAYVKPAVGKSLPTPVPTINNRCTRFGCDAWRFNNEAWGKTYNPQCKLLGHRWARNA